MTFDQHGNLYVDQTMRSYIPAKHVRIIRHNFALGIPFPQVSPVYAITREQLAAIVSADLMPMPA